MPHVLITLSLKFPVFSSNIQIFRCGYSEFYPWPGPLKIPNDGRPFIKCQLIDVLNIYIYIYIYIYKYNYLQFFIL